MSERDRAGMVLYRQKWMEARPKRRTRRVASWHKAVADSIIATYLETCPPVLVHMYI